jgi:peptidyl-tRNA hydrolase, PTH2 family
MSSQDDYTLYVIVNNDLSMGKGKIAAQVGHVIEKIIERILNTPYVNQNNKNLIDNYKIYSKTGNKKIILKGTQKDLEELCNERDAVHIIDAGMTQIEAGSLTVVGFLPSNKNKQRFGKFKLL